MSRDTRESDQEIKSEDISREESHEQDALIHGMESLPIVDQLFVDEEVPGEIIQAITSHLLPNESIFVLFQLNSSYSFEKTSEKVPLWTIMTGTRLLLLAVASEGQSYCDTFDHQTIIEYQTGLTRDEIRIADKTIMTGIWEGKRKRFKEIVQFFPLPEYEKYLYLARFYLKQENYPRAIPFLQTSIEIEPTITGYLLLVHALSRTGAPDKAIDVLEQACYFADPAVILQELQRLFPENLVLFLYLAVVYEKNHWWDHGITIYQALLQKTPDFDLYFLKLGEMYNLKGEYQTAIEQYRHFITLRTQSEKSEDGGFLTWDLSDSKCFSADPDLAKAFFDLGVIYERELNDLEDALQIYLSLIRHAPFYTAVYPQFWQVYQMLLKEQHMDPHQFSLQMQMFLQVYKLLDPQSYASTVRLDPISLSGREEEPEIRFAYRQLNEEEHEILTHPGEREYWRRIQSWLTNLVVSEEDNQSIEQYCEQVTDSNYPTLARTIQQIAHFLGVEIPRCFISRGKIGISVKNTEQPFLFIGSEHLNETNERYFSETEVVFIVAAQVKHIKSGHLLITGTELWKSLGSASFDGFLVALQCLPAGGFLGKMTYKFATEGLKRVYKVTKYSSVQKILKFLDRQVSDRGADDFSEEQEDAFAEQKNGRSTSPKASESDSLLKDQLIDFARHAVYTADRVGLLASHNIGAACSAIFKLADDAYDDLKHVFDEGLLNTLKKRDKRGEYVYVEYAKRFSELVRFALSEDYQRLHERIMIVDEDSALQEQISTEHLPLLKKLHLLEQSRHNELLTPEEFFLKQHHLLKNAGFLREEDEVLVEKLQQACRDGVLTYEELQTKIIQLLETRAKGG